ncbi:4'-phosphopantetheinyl transferase superfamily protein [Streptomyces sp. NPDC048295]|uniref:4'-phosphopantetheinyl transferase family protein n=1 Tax=Streptomyces sp. NPDC048295 TaxID=3154617 RepID=UPI00343A9057
MTPTLHPLTDARHRRVTTAAGPVGLWWYTAPQARPVPGRVLLRHAVEAQNDRPADTVTLVRDPLGRPALAPEQNLPPLRLTAAHCGPVTVAALIAAPGNGTRIGIDIEQLASPPSPNLLRYALSPGERAALAHRPATVRSAEFLTLWTAKEAIAKALGWSLLRALVDVEITLRPRLSLARLGQDPAPLGWQLFPLHLPGTPHTITLVTHHPPSGPRRENAWTSPAEPR